MAWDAEIDPDLSFDASIDAINGNFTAVVQEHQGASAPAEAIAGMTFRNTSTKIREVYNQAEDAWIAVGQLDSNDDPKTYWGLLPRDGSVAMDADLDLGNHIIDGWTSQAATAGPSHTSGDKWFPVKDHTGSTFYLHGQQTAP